MAAGSFGCGLIDEGYQALEDSTDLYVKLYELPDDTVLLYNSSALDLLTVQKKDLNPLSSVAREVFAHLTNPSGWEWFNGVRNDERYKVQVDRIREYVPKE